MKGFAVFLRGPGNHVGWKPRCGRCLVPVERLQVVANVLLVERRWARARAVLVDRPEAGRVGRKSLVDQDELSARVGAELELGVGDDDAALAGEVGGLAVQVD